MASEKYIVTGGDSRFRTYVPPEILVDDKYIEDDEQLNSIIPAHRLVAGAIVYNADYSIIKCRTIDGNWVYVKGGGTDE